MKHNAVGKVEEEQQNFGHFGIAVKWP